MTIPPVCPSQRASRPVPPVIPDTSRGTRSLGQKLQSKTTPQPAPVETTPLLAPVEVKATLPTPVEVEPTPVEVEATGTSPPEPVEIEVTGASTSETKQEHEHPQSHHQGK